MVSEFVWFFGWVFFLLAGCLVFWRGCSRFLVGVSRFVFGVGGGVGVGLGRFVFCRCFFVLFLFFSSFSYAQQVNLSVEGEGARVLLAQGDGAVLEMRGAGFFVRRADDVLSGARQLFEAQKALELSGGRADYSGVLGGVEEVFRVKKKAFDARDEIDALELRVGQVEGEVNTTSLRVCLLDARREFVDERFEESVKVVDSCYTKLSQLQGEAARERAFYSAASRTVANFLRENWRLLSVLSFVVVVLLLLFRRQIVRYRVGRRVRHLEVRRGLLKELLKGTQREYFELGRISELSYHVKLKKFSELVRDIDREVPLLREEIEKTKR